MHPTEASAPPPASRRVTVAAGVGLHCVTWAPGAAGLPFVLVHGLASNARTWEGVAERLAAAGHPVTTVDLRGHGRSDRPDDGYDFATMGDDVLRVIDAVGYARPVVVGQSTGGNLALDLARRASDRLAGIGGVDGGVIELQRRWPVWEDCAEALAPPRWEGMSPAAFEARLRHAHPTWSDWGIEATAANLELAADGTLRPRLTLDRHLRILRALWDHRPSAVLAGIAVPVLLVVAGRPTGGDGPVAASDAGGAAAALARSRVHHLPHADHDVHVQQPDTVATLLVDAAAGGFFDSLPGPAPAS